MDNQSDSDDEFNKTFIDDNAILDKYQASAEVADKALAFVIEMCVPDADIATVCKAGDVFIEAELKKVYCGKKTKSLERGIGSPTCICPNNITLNYSPLLEESKTMVEGDVITIDLAAHIDGYLSVSGTSMVVSSDKSKKIDGELANLMVAGKTALEAVVRTTIAGKTNEDVTQVIADVAAAFGVSPVEGVQSHKHKKHVIDESDIIMNKLIPERRAEKYTFEQGDVFGVAVYLCIGEGKPMQTENRSTVFQRVIENTYMLKSQAARDFFKEINERFPSFPFSITSFDDLTKAKLGVKHCEVNDLIEPHEVIALKDGNICVGFFATVAVLPSATSIISGNSNFDLSQFSPNKKIEDAELSSLLALSMTLKDQKKRNKKAKKEAKAEEEKKE